MSFLRRHIAGRSRDQLLPSLRRESPHAPLSGMRVGDGYFVEVLCHVRESSDVGTDAWLHRQCFSEGANTPMAASNKIGIPAARIAFAECVARGGTPGPLQCCGGGESH